MNSIAIYDIADILGIKHAITLDFGADINCLCLVVMRDGILNNTESAPEMENLVADFVVSIKHRGCSL